MNALGVHTFGLVWQSDAATAIEKLAENGFRRFQLLAMAPHLDPWATGEKAIADIRRAVASCKGEILAVDLPSSDINLASTTPRAVDFAVETYLRAMDIASAVGARWLTVNSGRRHILLPPPDNRLVHIYRDALERLVDAAKQRGLRILIENIPGTVLEEAATLGAFLDEENYGIVDVLYDVTNATAIGEDPLEGLDILGDKIHLMHLSDAPAGAWRHGPIGSGDIDFRALLEKLLRMGYNRDVVLELVSEQTHIDLLESRERLKQLGWTIDSARA
jgi:sugar phosphate isomerase/epimerase